MTDTKVPVRPRRVVRLGFAGNTKWPQPDGADSACIERIEAEACAAIASAMHSVYDDVATMLVNPSVHDKALFTQDKGKPDPIQQYYSEEAPLLRLITGLAEGADDLAATVLEEALLPGVDRELAAVLPCVASNYRATRPESYQAKFDTLYSRCAYVLELDGKHEKPDKAESERLGKEKVDEITARRLLSYRGQSTTLLRHCDLLIAVADLSKPGGVGGTLETVRKALEFQLPVLLIGLVTGANGGLEAECRLLQEPRQLERVQVSALTPDWRVVLQKRLRLLLLGAEHPGQAQEGAVDLVGEYFDSVPEHNQHGWFSFSKWKWSRLDKHLKIDTVSPADQETLFPFEHYRDRARALNYHYSDVYRGVFYTNFLLAVAAVALAGISLTLLAIFEGSATLYWSLFALALVKLAVVRYIGVSTKQGNAEQWNERAVQYRYFAERLRVMRYLPRVGSFQPPAAEPAAYASRVVRQKAVDWLFDAVVRATPPQSVADRHGKTLFSRNTAGVWPVVMSADVAEVAVLLRDDWVAQQAVYHRRSEVTNIRLHERAEHLAESLSSVVFWFVVVDVGLLLYKAMTYCDCVPSTAFGDALKFAGAVLILATAVLPALIAAQNGIRFQSECLRLSERSEFLKFILWGEANSLAQAKAQPAGYYGGLSALVDSVSSSRLNSDTDTGGWSIDLLLDSERIALDLVEEVAEWSVLYTKEMPDPG